MAGSYQHLLPDDEDSAGWSMVENMGDAHECVEELFWLIESGLGRKKAKRLLEREFYPMLRGEIKIDKHLEFVQKQMGK
jgi:hypothetical protein